MPAGLFRSLSIVLVVAIGAGCNGAPPPPEPVEPPPFFQISRISNGTPEIGETVEVEWEYGQDLVADFEPTVKRQVFQLQSLTIDGSVFRETFGCFPAEISALGDPDAECLPLDQRKLEFEFRGPVMLWIMAWDTEPTAESPFWREQRVVKFTLPGTSFSATLENVHSAGYPAFGLGSGTVTSLVFDRVFGIHEVTDEEGNEDGIIDELGPGSDFATLFPSIVESLTAEPTFPVFFARSTSPNESDDFGLQRGSNFPALPPEFFETEEGRTFEGTKTLADNVIFA